MDDWEQHFADKSRRRFEKERGEQRRVRTRLTIAGAVVAIIVIGSVVGLAILT